MSLILAAKLGIVWDCLLLAVGEFPDFPIIFGARLLDSSKVIITVIVMMITKTMKGLAYMMMLIDHAVINVTTLARKMCFFCIHKQFQFSFQILSLCTSE